MRLTKNHVLALTAAATLTLSATAASAQYGTSVSNSVREYGAEPQTGLRSDVRAHNAAQVRTRGHVRASRNYGPGPFALPGAAIGAAGAVAGAAIGGAANVAGAVVGGPANGAYAYDSPYAANAAVGYGSHWSGYRDSQLTPGFNAPAGAAQGQHYETPIGYDSIFTSPMQ